jgi:hypothetical protein
MRVGLPVGPAPSPLLCPRRYICDFVAQRVLQKALTMIEPGQPFHSRTDHPLTAFIRATGARCGNYAKPRTVENGAGTLPLQSVAQRIARQRCSNRAAGAEIPFA